jgi:hypothetical protein
MRVLFVCTSNKDRSPALEKHFKEKYPLNQLNIWDQKNNMKLHRQNEYISAGINKYFCKKKNTKYIHFIDAFFCDLIVFAEEIHKVVFFKTMSDAFNPKTTKFLVLGLGSYEKGNITNDYLTRAEIKIIDFIKQNETFSLSYKYFFIK